MRMIFYRCLFYLWLVFNSAWANFLEAKITRNSNIEWVFNDCGCNKPPHIRNAVLAVKPMDDDKRCQNCITCKELESPMALFFERYGQITNLESTMVQDPVKWQQLISNWLNQKLGFNLTYKVYETFASNCLGDSLINDSSWVYLWSEMGYERIAIYNATEDKMADPELHKGAPSPEFITSEKPVVAYHWQPKPENYQFSNLEAYSGEKTYGAPMPQASPGAENIACQCEKVLKIQFMLENGQSTDPPDQLWSQLFGGGNTAWASAGSSYEDIKKKCCKLWNQVPINGPEDCNPENYQFGAPFSSDAKSNIDQYLMPPMSDPELSALADAPCANKPADTCRRALDTCACNKLLTLYADWRAAGSPGSYNSWFALKTGVSINPPSSPEAMMNLCNKLFKTGSGEDANGASIPWTGSSVWNATAFENLNQEAEDEDLIVPGAITCNACGGGGGGGGWIAAPCYPKIPDCESLQADLMEYLQNNAPVPYSQWYHLGSTKALKKTLESFMNWQDAVDGGQSPEPGLLNFLQGLRNKLDTKYNPCPGNHDDFDIDYYLTRMMFCSEESGCDSCWGEKREYLWAVRKFLDAISANRADISNGSRFNKEAHKLHCNNWLLKKGTRDITEFYKSKWYEGYNNENFLRYFHLKYLMPDMRVSVNDQHGYDFRFQIGYDAPQDWYNFSRIYSVDSIRLKQVPNCQRRDYFYLWVTQIVPKKYWNTVQGKVCVTHPIFNTVTSCTKQVKMIGRIITPKGKLAKKVSCNTSCLKLCNTPFAVVSIPVQDPCQEEKQTAFYNAMQRYNAYIKTRGDWFDSVYREKCFGAKDSLLLEQRLQRMD